MKFTEAAGANPTDAHPVFASRMKRRLRQGAKLIVIDPRRIELVDPDLPAAPVHHHGGAHAMHGPDEPLDDAALAALVAEVRASAVAAAAVALDELGAAAGAPLRSLSLVAWPDDFPDDIAVVRRVPYESRVDSVMYRQVTKGE